MKKIQVSLLVLLLSSSYLSAQKNDNFEKRTTWKHGDNYVSIFSKNKGRANTENKYDLPPPLDNDLYFGTIVIVKHTEQNINNNNPYIPNYPVNLQFNLSLPLYRQRQN